MKFIFSMIVGACCLVNINAQDFNSNAGFEGIAVEDNQFYNEKSDEKSAHVFNSLGIQLFNTVGYSDLEASFWASVSKNSKHNVNLRLSHNRFEGEYFSVGIGYGYELYADNHLFLPYTTYNQDVETWKNQALVNGLYYSYGGRFDFAVGTTTNFNKDGYANNSLWVDAYYNIKAFGGIQIGAEYCIMSDTGDAYYGIIFQKTLWRRK